MYLNLSLKMSKKLYHDITDTLDSGHKVFIGGCGATGRLSLALEAMWN